MAQSSGVDYETRAGHDSHEVRMKHIALQELEMEHK